jgi:starvation-inducible DNA-binding protein
MQAQIGLNEEVRHRVSTALQHLLADEIALYLKTRNFHWNVEGQNFLELHQLFQQQYETLDEIMDSVAERIRALGGYAAGSMNEYVRLTRLPEVTGGSLGNSRMEMLLLHDHESVIRELRTLIDVFEDLGDAGTQDFVTSIMAQHEKMAWMLRALVN